MEEQLVNLLNAGDLLEQFVALASAAMPGGVLASWAAPSQHWALGYAIARNSSASDETLQQLTHDGNRYIRAAARATLAQRSAGG